MDTPLSRSILIGRFRQDILYKGISLLCFSVGRMGHRKNYCPYIIKEMVVEMDKADESELKRNDNKRQRVPISMKKKREMTKEIMAFGC